jgi:hypothetical protein
VVEGLRMPSLGGVKRKLGSVEGLGVEAEADWKNLRTPETYLGYDRSAEFASPNGATLEEDVAYELPERLPLNQWALAGEWTIWPRGPLRTRFMMSRVSQTLTTR